MPKVYLAGPDVFLPDAIAVGIRKKSLCAEYGFEGLYPLDIEISQSLSGDGSDWKIYRANENLVRDADFGIFNLTPFRGPSADVGTVFELGMLVGLGKPVFGYTNVVDDLLDRCKLFTKVTFDSVSKTWRDSAGMTVENFRNADNLMIENSLILHGGYPIVRHNALPEELFQDLTGFEKCLRLAAKTIPKSKVRGTVLYSA